jgi:hypothetical protein
MSRPRLHAAPSHLRPGTLRNFFGYLAFFSRHRTRTDRTFESTPTPSVTLSYTSFHPGASLFSIFLILILNLVFTLCLQNHPHSKKRFLMLLDERSQENKRGFVSLEKLILSRADMQLFKASWKQFGLFNGLNDEFMKECIQCMRV